jgi:2-keto-4-pentenoate hydratase
VSGQPTYDALLQLRAERLAAGERPIGWKVGFGSTAAIEMLGTTAALVGFLTARTLVEPGGQVSLEGWANPMLEPEIAITVDGDGGILSLGAAIELADLDPPPTDPAAILAGNIYHRAVLLGREQANSVDGLTVRVLRGGETIAATDDPEQLTGPLEAIVRLVRETVGELLRPGDVIIAGSTVPPIPVAAGQTVRYELAPLGSISVSLSASASSVSS